MKKLALIIILLISILAPAHSIAFTSITSNTPIQSENVDSDKKEDLETEIAIDTPGFDKQLTIVVLNPEITRFNIKLSDSSGTSIVSSTLVPTEEGIATMDLSDFEQGFYQITTQIGENVYEQTIVLP